MAYIGNRPLAIMLTSLLGADQGPETEEELIRFLRSLLTADWESDDSAFRLNSNLALEQVSKSEFLDQTRIFLRTLAEDKGAPLTERGNLNRASITRFLERMAWPRRVRELYTGKFGFRLFNEQDVEPLHHIRLICELGNLTVKRRSRLFATKRAIALCDDAQIGVLFRHLFVTFFRLFDLDYLGGSRETPGVQDTLPVILWRLSLKANDWIAAGKLTREVFLPLVGAQIRQVDPWSGAEAAVLVIRVLEPLTWFGLLEADTAEDDFRRFFEDREFRKTPLFDQFLSFVLKP